MQLTQHFKLDEFKCKCGCDKHKKHLKDLTQLAEALEKLREKLDNTPIYIMSGFRCPAHNTKCGGAKKSQHMLGKAADIQVKGWVAEDIGDIAVDIFGDTGLYKSWVHVDIRRGYAFWDKT